MKQEKHCRSNLDHRGVHPTAFYMEYPTVTVTDFGSYLYNLVLCFVKAIFVHPPTPPRTKAMLSPHICQGRPLLFQIAFVKKRKPNKATWEEPRVVAAVHMEPQVGHGDVFCTGVVSLSLLTQWHVRMFFLSPQSCWENTSAL